MNRNEIEKKWQDKWRRDGINTFDPEADGEKHYVLEMLPYPSGAKLHMGHWYNYGVSDSYARFMRMNGKNVFQPMGFDAFGLPAENYAIKTGVHPKDSTDVNIETMERQLRDMGTMFDWSHEFRTCAPDYYKWTQWLFLQLYKKGLAYKKGAAVNWCEKCATVLANEQVIDGKCWRCDSDVTKKNLEQWFLKITDYAEVLLEDLNKLEGWGDNVKTMQANWIGKSKGTILKFKVKEFENSCSCKKEGCNCDSNNLGLEIPVYTTRPDTAFGITYLVVAPEYPDIEKLTTPAEILSFGL